MDTRHFNGYFNLIEALLQCPNRSPISPSLPDPELATVSSLRSPNGHIDHPVDPDSIPRSSPSIDNHIHPDASTNNGYPHETRTEVSAPIKKPAPRSDRQIEELLSNISNRLDRIEISIGKHSMASNPLWYMPILEQVDTHGWIIFSEEVEQ